MFFSDPVVTLPQVIFGLFNIITAIFVEATLIFDQLGDKNCQSMSRCVHLMYSFASHLRNGLRENELQRRYAKAYESSYMTEQLAKLVMTVSTQVEKLRSRRSERARSFFGDVNFLG